MEVFIPIQEGKVGMYSCGPTVYNFAHIGNYRAYIVNDLIARVLHYNGYSVNHVMNITDVDDKTIRDSQTAHQSLESFTSKYTAEFLRDLADLNITSITYHPKATNHIAEMIELIRKLLVSGAAYRGDDGCIYYSIATCKNYGKLSGLDRGQLQSDASGRVRNDDYTKEHVQDFALWKAWSEEDGIVGWDSPFGKGRPGWHIECSAMSIKYLGASFDIHAGGIDLLFPHHENEIAQSEAATHSVPFVKYWIHNEWLLVDGKKMSKRLGNFFTLRDLFKQGFYPLAFRFFCLQTHYRQQLNFTLSALTAAEKGLQGLNAAAAFVTEGSMRRSPISDNQDFHTVLKTARDQFREGINDDFNSPKALASFFSLIHTARQMEQFLSRRDFMKLRECVIEFDDVLGLKLIDGNAVPIPNEIIELAYERQRARDTHEWNRADELRLTIESRGFAVEDTQNGPRIVKL